ncbi:MAG: hypothetical protein IT349_10370 [Candidatus Eisenbacteria bacterium]|nr:hypothetical protein [Candidatus Eisenbacteria bacterium]
MSIITPGTQISTSTPAWADATPRAEIQRDKPGALRAHAPTRQAMQPATDSVQLRLGAEQSPAGRNGNAGHRERLESATDPSRRRIEQDKEAREDGGSFWTTLGTLILGPIIGTSIGSTIDSAPRDDSPNRRTRWNQETKWTDAER